MSNIETLKDLLSATVEARGDSVAIRHKHDGEWLTFTYSELFARAMRVSALLKNSGMGRGKRVGLHLENGPRWPELYFGIIMSGATAVPVDPKLKEHELTHVFGDSGICVLFSDVSNYPLLRDIETHLPELKTVILINGQAVMPVSDTQKVEYLDLDSALADHENPDPPKQEDDLAPNDPASIIYTSGTVGHQKGVVLTHRNFVSNVLCSLRAVAAKPEDNFLLVLPLHHSFAFTANLLLPVAAGAEISIVESLRTVGENISEVSPSVLIVVPLLIEKLYRRIMSGIKKSMLARTMLRLGMNRPISRKVIERLGGKLRLVVVGGAPCPPDLLKGVNKLGIRLVEGYGLTETAPVLTFNPLEAPKPGTVGKPLPDVEIRIVDPGPDHIGEIAARGPNIMQGYLNDPEATQQVFRDGWLLTGDLGFIDDDGYLHITGRRKNLIVNREGKNIFPEEIEREVCKSQFIIEALALGYKETDSTGEKVGLIVVPDVETLDRHAAEQGKPMSDSEIERLIGNEVRDTCSRLADYKRPRRIQIRSEEFEKTSTAKIKRYLYTMKPTSL